MFWHQVTPPNAPRKVKIFFRLQCRLWKEISLRIAFPLLLSVPAYQGFSQDQIKYALERAFVPDLSFVTVFTVTEIIQDVILVEGVAAEYNTREKFLAPCVIPRLDYLYLFQNRMSSEMLIRRRQITLFFAPSISM